MHNICLKLIIVFSLAVPLSPRHPENLLDYFVQDSEASILITIPEYEKLLTPLADKHKRPLIVVDHCFIPLADPNTSSVDPKIGNISQTNTNELILENTLDNKFYSNSNALILYTSGSTGKPKGVVLTYKNLHHQIDSLTEAWNINHKDSMLHVLPLNHVHGCVNGLLCPLSVGAKLSMLPRFESSTVWSNLLNVNMPSKHQINLFMAVPTMYNLLLTEYDKVFSKNSRMVDYIRAQCEKKIRLMISGSAPLPPTVFARWHSITGHQLLERYGMTEIGMALSNPYQVDKVRNRIPGTVGSPLPGLEVKLVNDEKNTVFQLKGESGKGAWSSIELPVYEKNDTNEENLIGELYVRGPGIFTEYLNKPNETKEAFSDGWFKTGDQAQYKNNSFNIVGRISVDIIKTGGYKVSALEIESHLLEHPSVEDVCVVGVPDITWGQRIAALIVLKPDQDASDSTVSIIKEFCQKNVATYQVPTVFKIIQKMPRNAMGKINKKDVLKEYFPNDEKN